MSPGGRVRGRASTGADANTLCQFGHRLLSSKTARLKDHWTLAQILVANQSARPLEEAINEPWTLAPNQAALRARPSKLLATGHLCRQYQCLRPGFKGQEGKTRPGRSASNRSGIHGKDKGIYY